MRLENNCFLYLNSSQITHSTPKTNLTEKLCDLTLINMFLEMNSGSF